MRTVTNLETGRVKTFETDQEFLDYAREIYFQNEENEFIPISEIHFLPEHIGNALEYIHEYCGDLELTED